MDIGKKAIVAAIVAVLILFSLQAGVMYILAKGDYFTGPMGQQGIQGINGDKGDMGQQGTPGITGPAGQKGVKGATGSTGSAGRAGRDALVNNYPEITLINMTSVTMFCKTTYVINVSIQDLDDDTLHVKFYYDNWVLVYENVGKSSEYSVSVTIKTPLIMHWLVEVMDGSDISLEIFDCGL